MTDRRQLRSSRIAPGVAVTLLLLLGCRSEIVEAPVTRLVLAPEQARDIAIDRLREMRSTAVELRLAIAEIPIGVTSVRLIDGGDLDRLLDRETATELDGVRVFLVAATGPFLSAEVSGNNPITAGSGWFAIDAVTGEVLAMGSPSPALAPSPACGSLRTQGCEPP